MAKNSIGESISREARMTIRTSSNTNEESVDGASRPQFVQVPAGHVYSNDEADFIVMHCIASGIPQPHISWSFNNQPLHENEHVHIYDNGTLVISHPAEEHEGNYKCEATNYLGTISTVANYKINGKKKSGMIYTNFYLLFSQGWRIKQQPLNLNLQVH